MGSCGDWWRSMDFVGGHWVLWVFWGGNFDMGDFFGIDFFGEV